MGIVDKVKKIIDWKPPSSKESGNTNEDTLFSDETIKYVEKYYNDKNGVIAKRQMVTKRQLISRYNGPSNSITKLY